MITIEEFWDIEGNPTTKKLILDAIEANNGGLVGETELIFNVYSLQFDWKRNIVTIYNDITPSADQQGEFDKDEFVRLILLL